MTAEAPLGWQEFFDPRVAGSGESSMPFLSVAHALAQRASVVAEVGCGRGAWSEVDPNAHRLFDFRGPGRTVIGIDIDPVGTENPMIDEFRLIPDSLDWPLEDASTDLVVSDWTLEHVADPDAFVAELTRVLRPGGAFVARTVSRHSPLSVAARAVPNERHPDVIARLQPGREAKDVFPTEYRMNTEADLGRLLDTRYDWAVSHRSDLSEYFRRWPALRRTIAATEPHLPKALRSTLVIFARKR